MNKQELKAEILRCGIARQQEIVEDFRTGIKELEQSIGSSGEAQMDNARIGANNEIKERAHLLGRQPEIVEAELMLLRTISPSAPIHHEVHVGSVVMTNHMNFFVSVSIEEFEACGVHYFGMSTKAPIYEKMKGKRIGDTFEFNGKSYHISDLF